MCQYNNTGIHAHETDVLKITIYKKCLHVQRPLG